MNAVKTYLRQLGFWLPRRKRADILSELRGALDERIECAELAEGRPLRQNEVERLLRSFGNPMLVLVRYVRRPPVISGGLALFYWRVLAMALIAIVVVQSAVLLTEVLRAPALLPTLLSGLRRAALSLMLGFTCVTAVFMILEWRYGPREN